MKLVSEHGKCSASGNCSSSIIKMEKWKLRSRDNILLHLRNLCKNSMKMTSLAGLWFLIWNCCVLLIIQVSTTLDLFLTIINKIWQCLTPSATDCWWLIFAQTRRGEVRDDKTHPRIRSQDSRNNAIIETKW